MCRQGLVTMCKRLRELVDEKTFSILEKELRSKQYLTTSVELWIDWFLG